MKCPFCKSELLYAMEPERPLGAFGSGKTWNKYYCPTRIKFDGKVSFSHYEFHEFGDDKDEEYWYIPPYQIVTRPKETIVGKVDENDTYRATYTGRPNFKLVFTMTEKIPIDKPEKLLARIKLLTVFS